MKQTNPDRMPKQLNKPVTVNPLIPSNGYFIGGKKHKWFKIDFQNYSDISIESSVVFSILWGLRCLTSSSSFCGF